MKILHISTGGSSSSAVVRLHKALLNNGVDSEIVILREEENLSNVNIYKSSKIEYYTRKIGVLLEKKRLLKYNIKKNELFSTGLYGYKLEDIIKDRNVDIVHLHWINGSFINIKSIENVKVPIIWTCHDSWPFTGGCHVKYNCNRYRTECNKCLLLNSTEFSDLSNYIFNIKKDVYSKKNITFIAPSQWMMDEFKNSNLISNQKSYVIGNTIDFDIFNINYNVKNIINKYGINRNIFTIVFGAVAPKSVPYKGYNIIIEFIKRIKAEKNFSRDNFQLIIFGTDDISEIKELGINCISTGHIKNQNILSEIYNCADLLLYPSIEDNLPNVVIESLACGVPVVAFDIGGIPEIVSHKKNGFLASKNNINELIAGVEFIRNSKLDRNIIRNSVFEKYSESIIINKYIEIYTEVIN